MKGKVRLSLKKMMRRGAFVLMIGMGMCVCSSADTPSDFLGLAQFDTGQVVVALTQDLPTDGFENRFHFLMGAGAPLFEFTDQVWVKVGCEFDGALSVRIDGVCSFTLYPFNADIGASFAGCAPQFEDRLQWVQITYQWGYWEILIEEPLF